MARVRRPTSTDVAARAGVSRATVSYVLNGSTRHTFPQATRERILAAASELGYTPHAAARELRRGTSGVVLFVVGDLPVGTNLAALLGELTAAVSATGRSLLTWSAGAGPTLSETLGHLEPLVVVATTPLPPRDRDTVRAAGIPLVTTPWDPATGEEGDPATGEAEVGRAQSGRLTAAGHRRIGVVTTGDARLARFATGRLHGLRRAAAELDLPEPETLVLDAHDEAAVAALAEVLRTWCAGPEPVTALACYNDLYAGLALAAARAAGLGVPRDLSIIGVDDDPMGAFLDPPLTTIGFDFATAARKVVRSIAAAVDGPTDDGPTDDEPATARRSHVLVPVERSSVGPPAISTPPRPAPAG
jgi:DNA-binding LacI/PurR family transcriptional regulator